MPDPNLLALATTMRNSCPCTWTDEQRNRIIAYLAPLGGSEPGFPLLIITVGQTWIIKPSQP
jgi:hypothetical protein